MSPYQFYHRAAAGTTGSKSRNEPIVHIVPVAYLAADPHLRLLRSKCKQPAAHPTVRHHHHDTYALSQNSLHNAPGHPARLGLAWPKAPHASLFGDMRLRNRLAMHNERPSRLELDRSHLPPSPKSIRQSNLDWASENCWQGWHRFGWRQVFAEIVGPVAQSLAHTPHLSTLPHLSTAQRCLSFVTGRLARYSRSHLNVSRMCRASGAAHKTWVVHQSAALDGLWLREPGKPSNSHCHNVEATRSHFIKGGWVLVIQTVHRRMASRQCPVTNNGIPKPTEAVQSGMGRWHRMRKCTLMRRKLAIESRPCERVCWLPSHTMLAHMRCFWQVLQLLLLRRKDCRAEERDRGCCRHPKSGSSSLAHL